MGQCCSKPTETTWETKDVMEFDQPVHQNQHQPSKKKDEFGMGNHFETLHLLGEGGSGETWLMRDRETQELVAVKLIPRPIPKALHQMLLQEILIQRDLGQGHVNIVTSKEVVLTRTHLAFVLEFVSGGTLTKYVSDRWSTVGDRKGLFLSEEEARFFYKVMRMHRGRGR